MEKQNKGITLIALVITIIVLLILAGVSIATLTGENGILTRADDARNTTNNAEIEEKIKLAYQDYYVGQHTETGYTFQKALDKMLGEGVLTVTESNGVYKINFENGKTYSYNSLIKELIDWDTVIANAQRHPEQDPTIPEIGIDMYGNSVNLKYWCYELNETDKTFATGKGVGSKPQVGYIGNIVGGKIIGEIPQYIIKDNKTYTLTSLKRAFTNLELLITAPAIPNTVIDLGGEAGQAQGAFSGCTSLTTAPTIPNSVTNMAGTFFGCTSLTTAPTIPNSVTNMHTTFGGCTSLTAAPTIPNSVTNMQATFNGCTSLTTAPTIPNSVINMWGTFSGCILLTTAPTIPNSVTNMNTTFGGCTSLTGNLIINADNVAVYFNCLSEAATNDSCNLIVSGTCTQLDSIISTKSENSHITKGN